MCLHRSSDWWNFYRTQVSLGSGLWVPVSLPPYKTFLKLCWCDSSWWWYQVNMIDDANIKQSLAICNQVAPADGHGSWQRSRWGGRRGGWQGGWHGVKIPNEDITHVILTIDDSFGDDVRGGAGGDGHGGSGRWEGRQKGCGIVKESRPCQHASWLRLHGEEAANSKVLFFHSVVGMFWVMNSIPWVRCASGNV